MAWKGGGDWQGGWKGGGAGGWQGPGERKDILDCDNVRNSNNHFATHGIRMVRLTHGVIEMAEKKDKGHFNHRARMSANAHISKDVSIRHRQRMRHEQP